MTTMSEHDTQAQAFLQSYQNTEVGDAEVQYQTGLDYAQGIGVVQDYRMAGLYWLNAAKQSHPAAQTRLGILFEKGLGYKQDLDKAIHCYQSAADLGFAEAKVRLAMAYLTGRGLPQDAKKAILLFIQAAEQGEAAAQYNLGIAYEKGLGGLKQNDDLAHFWYHQAAHQNHKQAIFRLQDEKFTQKPSKTTFAAADLTHSKTQNSHHLASDCEPVNTNDTAIHLESDTSDFSEFAFVTENISTAPSKQTSFNDEDLPVHPDSEAIFAKGVSAIDDDLKKAFNFFEQAALLGHAKAEYNMGLAFLYGLGGNHICTDTAIEWLEKSSNQSFRPAYLVLGWLYQGGNPYFEEVNEDIGETIILDHDNAISQYEMASELGHAQAQYFLSKIYASGNGVTADADKSAAWLKQSAKHGYLAAVNELRQISSDANHTNSS